MPAQFAAEIFVRLDSLHERHIGVDALTLDGVGASDHGRFGHRLVQDQRALDLGRAEPVSGNVDDVVHPSGDPEVAVFITPGAVPGEVEAGEPREVGVEEPLVVSVHGAHLPGPGTGEAEVSGNGALEPLPRVVHDPGFHTEERQGGRTRLQSGRAGKGGDQNAARLGLPPGVHDGDARATHDPVIPLPSLRVDGFPDRAEQPQAAARRAEHRIVSLLHQRPDRRRRGVEDVDLVLVDDLPEPSGIGIRRHPLEHEGGRPVRKGAVHDVRMAGDPPHIRRAPVDIAIVIVEHVAMSHGGIEDVASGGMQHALRLAGGAGGVQDEQRVFGVHLFRWAVLRSRLHEVVVPVVAARLPPHITPRTANHHDMLDARGAVARRVAVRLEGDPAAASDSLVGRDQDLAGRIVDSVTEGLGRKPAEHHRVDRPDPCAREHRDDRLRDHGHVDADAIALHHS